VASAAVVAAQIGPIARDDNTRAQEAQNADRAIVRAAEQSGLERARPDARGNAEHLDVKSGGGMKPS
jgi:hypothetical protein